MNAPLNMAIRTIASIVILLAISACAPVEPRAPMDPMLRERLAADRMNPAVALDIIEASERVYVVRPGQTRADSLAAEYPRLMRITPNELDPGGEDIWFEGSLQLHLRNYARAADLLLAVVDAFPGCADCRVEFARALLGVAASDTAENVRTTLRQNAADQLAIASALDPSLPVGRGMFGSPVWLGRTTIRTVPSSREARGKFREANDDFHHEDLAAARRKYREVIALEPDFARAYMAMGDTYSEERYHREAAIWYRRAISQDSTDYLSWRGLAMAFIGMDDWHNARDAATWAIISNYHDDESWKMLRAIGTREGFEVVRGRVAKPVDALPMQSGAVEIVVDSTISQLAQIAWLGYAFVRSVWQYEGRYDLRHGENGPYRITFEEELEATASLIAVWNSDPPDSVRNADLDRLTRITEQGFLVEYILFEELAASDPDVITRLSPRTLRRVKEYIDRYVIRGLPI